MIHQENPDTRKQKRNFWTKSSAPWAIGINLAFSPRRKTDIHLQQDLLLKVTSEKLQTSKLELSPAQLSSISRNFPPPAYLLQLTTLQINQRYPQSANMHVPSLSFLAIPLFLSTASAWTLDFYATDGRQARSSGTRDSGCINLSWTPALNVQRINFNPATPLYPDPGTVELYVNRGCGGLSYRNGGGNHVLTPPRVIRSYKVY